MLILAGVSLNAVVGQNGVLTQAQNAVIANKKAEILEKLDLELASYNIETITGNPEESTTMFSNLISKELIDTVLDKDGTYKTTIDSVRGIPNFDGAGNYTGYIDYSVKKDDYQIILSVDDTGIYRAEYGEVNISAGGSVSAGTTLVTSNAFESTEGATEEEKGKFTIDNNASVMFVDPISDSVSILVKNGVEANVSIFNNMTLTNTNIKRAAIDIETGGVLNLYIAKDKEVTVISGLGSAADTNNVPGTGGYAGIHVPGASSDTNSDGKITEADIKADSDGKYNCAVLNISGEGKLIAQGGNAGNAALFTGGSAGGSGGGGAGAGIGGNGGNGGKGKNGASESGKNGQACGIVTISGTVSVKATGGAAGAGANSNSTWASSGSGYPAAGIGGGGAGGAGGSCCAGGGGFQGGSSDYDGDPYKTNRNLTCGTNGFSLYFEPDYYTNWNQIGGSYYSHAINPYSSSITTGYCLSSDMNNDNILGGMGGCQNNLSHLAGNGGTAGSGGIIKYTNMNQIEAYNGSRINDGTATGAPNEQCIIYAQMGVITGKYQFVASGTTSVFQRVSDHVINGIAKSKYKNSKLTGQKVTINSAVSFLTNCDLSIQGVGSGAGYIELSNGTCNPIT